MLTITDSMNLTRPLVKAAYEPANAQDVPLEMSRAIHMATTPCPGPVYLAVAFDDWDKEADPQSAALTNRVVKGAGLADEESLKTLTARLEAAQNPVLVFGPDVDAAGANAHAVTLAEKLKAPVWVGPSAPRCPFPTTHPNFRGLLPAATAGISRLLSGHDLIAVFGAPVFRYHEYDPGPYLPQGASLFAVMENPEEAAHAPVGDAIVGDVGGILKALASRVKAVDRPQQKPRPQPAPASRAMSYIRPDAVFDIVAGVAPRDAIYVDESTSTTQMLWDRLPMANPGSYYFGGAGGLGFGMSAAVGVQLACPSRRVVAFVGDGSAN